MRKRATERKKGLNRPFYFFGNCQRTWQWWHTRTEDNRKILNRKKVVKSVGIEIAQPLYIHTQQWWWRRRRYRKIDKGWTTFGNFKSKKFLPLHVIEVFITKLNAVEFFACLEAFTAMFFTLLTKRTFEFAPITLNKWNRVRL